MSTVQIAGRPAGYTPPTLRERLAQGDNAVVLALLIAEVGIAITLPNDGWDQLLIAGLQGLAVVAALGRRVLSGRGLLLLLALALAVWAAAAAMAGSVPERGGVDLINAIVLLGLVGIIVWRFRRHLVVNRDTILGAICVYLAFGLLYANLDHAVARLAGIAFFAGVSQASVSQYSYFSFVTLCTVGYGDLSPAPGMPRALSVAEALMGQLYLVTIVALLVGNFGRSRVGRAGGE